MKSIYVSVIALLLCLPAMAQKQTKEEKQKARIEEEQERTKPRSVTIKTTPDAVKAELMKAHLTNGYTLCGEKPSQFLFCKGLPDKIQAYYAYRGITNLHLERIFTLLTQDQSVTVLAAIEVSETNRMGAEHRIREMDKKTRDELQDVLDKLKTTLEH